MSDRTTSPVPTQPQSPETGTPAPEPSSNGTPDTSSQEPAAQTQAAAVAVDAVAALADAEAAEEQAREAADATLKATVKAYRAGEKAYRVGLLEAGRLADVYVHQRMALTDKRAAAVQTLEGQLAMYASRPVQISELVACYQAYHLLAETALEAVADPRQAKAFRAAVDNVPYGHYREAYCQLVQRRDKDTPEEAWQILPGIEADARALFVKCVTDGLSKEAVQERCKDLQRHFAAQENARAQALAAERAKAEQAAEQARKAQAEAATKAAREAEAAQKAVDQAVGEDTRATLTAAAQAAADKLLQEQRANAAAIATAEQARKDREAADAEAKALADRADKAKAKADKAAAKAASKTTPAADTPATVKPATEPGTVTGNLLRSAALGTPKDVASQVVQLVTSNQDPDTVFVYALEALAETTKPETGKPLSPAARHVADIALVLTTDRPWEALRSVLHLIRQAKGIPAEYEQAVRAAELVLQRSDRKPASPSPVQVNQALEATNGTPAAAGAA